ncbi:Conserved_hypothetical protein [Hexamita inflata]|uniref:Uncharacterized protein n=1 Tax=Hexamita inflata TaxID=28002 RepID=A0AA86UI69_9EUKA|nr:Conserved hypothetical protein [Hexamita inflata]
MQPNQQQSSEKNIDKVNSETLNMPDNLSEYNKAMIEIYHKQFEDGSLRIQSNNDLKSLDFIRQLNINRLELDYCKYIIPNLESQTIKQFIITACEIQSLKDFKLHYLDVLEFSNIFRKEARTLILEIVRFQNLKELTLYYWITDISPLSQLKNLTKLYMNDCQLNSTESLKSPNLVELSLNSNKGINITSLQYLTNLQLLSLRDCNLVSIDALRPLTKLDKLNVSSNSIVYLQIVIELKQLSYICAHNNKIIDFESIKQHSNNFQKIELRHRAPG